MCRARTMWVYLVDDDATMAEMYRIGLEHRGFRVSIAGSGCELFSSLNGKAPDAVVLDYQLPEANGAEVLEMIRRDDRTRNVVVLMLSNFPDTYDGAIDRVIQNGALAWLEKVKTTPDTL